MFRDRRDAGRQLAQSLRRYRGPDTLVLGLPRGGVPVAAEVAAALNAPLDIIVVRKLGVPYQPELAMGAVGEGGVTVVNDEVVRVSGTITLRSGLELTSPYVTLAGQSAPGGGITLRVDPCSDDAALGIYTHDVVVRHLHMREAELSTVAARERDVVAVRALRFRPDRPALSLEGKVAVIVDDGIATGSTAHAACGVARAAGAALVVLAVPVSPADCHPEHWPEVDDFVCLQKPHQFYAVGQFYDDFGQTTDDEVAALLKLAAAAAAPASTSPPADETVRHIAPERTAPAARS